MTNEITDFNVRLIEDLPSEEDAFGPHGKVASAITKLISSKEPGGKAIGLEGSWGSGKSTIVKFIRDSLINNKNFVVINFDAWAHQGDPLRRTYLETVINRISESRWIGPDNNEQCWISSKDWEQKRLEIARRKKTTDITTYSTPTIFGFLFALSLLAVPFGVAILSSGFFQASKIANYAGILFSTAPILVIAINILRLIYQLKPGESLSLKDWAFIQGSETKTVKSDSIETPDPTSIEFEHYFNAVIREALNNNPAGRILLIFDNIDRVEPDSAISIWSTLQTFLQERNSQDLEWFSRVWILVPYDSAAIKKTWGNSANDSNTISDSFIDKSFQIRFQVPPPVLSDWVGHLQKLLQYALPKLSSEKCEEVSHEYRLFRDEVFRSQPTPRELKLFVNQIGTIVRQWPNDEFRINHIAYFILFSRRPGGVLGLLKSGDPTLLSDRAKRVFGEDLTQSLAGLAYNTDPKKGMELLLHEPIHRSLIDAHPVNSIEHLAKLYNTGLWPVLESYIIANGYTLTPDLLAQVASRLQDAGILSEAPRYYREKILGHLRSQAKNIASWPLDGKGVADGIIALCNLGNNENLSKSIGDAIEAGLQKIKAPELNASNSSARDVTNAVLKIIRTFKDLEHSAALPDRLTLPTNATDGWVEACTILDDPINSEFLPRLRPREDSNAILEGLIEAVVGNVFGSDHLRSIPVTNICVPDFDWPSLILAFQEKLDAGVGLNPEISLWLLKSLRVLKRLGKPVDGTYKTLAKGGHLLYHIHRATKAKNQDCLAQCLLLQLELDFPFPPLNALNQEAQAGLNSFNQIIAKSDPDLAKRMVAILSDETNTSKLVNIWNRRGALEPLLLDCLRVVANGDNPEAVFSAEIILGHWSELDESLPLDDKDKVFDLLIEKLADSHGLCDAIQKTEGGFSVSNVPLYWRLISQLKSRHPNFLAWCKGELEKRDSDEWRHDLDEAQDMLWTALLLKDNGAAPSFTTHLSDAIKSYAKKLAVDAKLPDEVVAKRWEEVLGLLRPEVLKATQQSILEIAFDSKGTASANFFALFGPLLINAELLVRSGHAATRLLSPIIETNNEAGLTWLSELIKAFPDILNQMPSGDNPEYIYTRILDIISSPDATEKNPLIQSIAENLGIAAQPLKKAEEITG